MLYTDDDFDQHVENEASRAQKSAIKTMTGKIAPDAIHDFLEILAWAYGENDRTAIKLANTFNLSEKEIMAFHSDEYEFIEIISKEIESLKLEAAENAAEDY